VANDRRGGNLVVETSDPGAPPEQLRRRLSEWATLYRERLETRVGPYWYDTAIDPLHGGYLLADHIDGRQTATFKQVVSQARMVWGFSHAHLHVEAAGGRDYLGAARDGLDFLVTHFRDPANGSYRWATGLDGRPLNDRRLLCGQVFVLYALCEHYRATGDEEVLARAEEVVGVIERMRDGEHGGWLEHFTPGLEPILREYRGPEVGRPGLKTANVYIHLVEALAEYYDLTGDARAAERLAEALDICKERFYPPEAQRMWPWRRRDWRHTGPRAVSYGHLIEFAWLMLRAEEVLGSEPSWEHFRWMADYTLRYGFDHERGGLCDWGWPDRPARRRRKNWWSQAELLVALGYAIERWPGESAYQRAADGLLGFVEEHMVRSEDGVWIAETEADGRLAIGAKAGPWKANYHDVRALVAFVERFGGVPGGPGDRGPRG
jgi:mannobiose 2-epimerase